MMAKRDEMNGGVDVPPVQRDTTGLRNALFDELDRLRQGRSNSAKANATAKLCATVIESVRMELEVRRYLQSVPQSVVDTAPALGEPIDLGE